MTGGGKVCLKETKLWQGGGRFCSGDQGSRWVNHRDMSRCLCLHLDFAGILLSAVTQIAYATTSCVDAHRFGLQFLQSVRIYR